MDTTHNTHAIDGTPDVLIDWLQGLRLGTPLHCGALTVVPVYGGETGEAVVYRTLCEAISLEEVVMVEKSSASVPTLQLLNHSALPVLILDGEEVVGGLQNRVVNTTLLVPPKSTFDLPVTCIEHGRWHGDRPTFESGETVHPSLRRLKAEQVTMSLFAEAGPSADQGAVWAEVSDRHRRTGTRSATAALCDAYAERADDLAQAERMLTWPLDRPTGVVALVEGRAVSADLFDRSETLGQFWQRLVRSYALEAVGAGVRAPRTLSVGSAARLLQRPVKARRTPFASPGLGVDVRIQGNGVVGASLLYRGSVLHAALFRQYVSRDASSITTPSARARHLPR